MIISVVLPDNINTASRASKEILSFKKLGYTVKLVYMPPAYAYEEMRNPNISSYVRIRLWSRSLPKNTFCWAIKYIEFFLRVFFSLVKQRPSVVFCHDLMPLLPSFIYSKVFFKKMIYDSHEIHRQILHPLQPVRFWNKVETYIINNIELTVITDHHRMNYMINEAGVKAEKIKPLYNFPHLSELRSAGKQLKTMYPGKKVVYTGIIMPGRYIDEVIKSIQYWKEDLNFYLVGDGGDEFINELKALSQELKISSRVHFLPAVKWNELVDFIDDSDVAFAFYKDNCLNNLYCSPNKLYEALASGTPVIGTENPMIKEVVGELDFGICLNFKSINAETIGSGVNEISEREYSNKKRLQVKQKIRDKYSWESQEHIFLQYCKTVINLN
jgi:glycosyltransferase involved in cell wall biosynthesis